MRSESFDDLIEILGRSLEIGQREGGWSPARMAQLADRTANVRLSIEQRKEVYEVAENAGITSNYAKAELAGVSEATVRRDTTNVAKPRTTTAIDVAKCTHCYVHCPSGRYAQEA